eukprot:3046376-Lingulodinium_polyedra.AAC.1
MYGLRPRSLAFAHTRIKKPWRTACVNSTLPNKLNRTCDGNHLHHPCESSDTLLTQGYTKEICRVIRNTVEHDVAALPGEWTKSKQGCWTNVCIPQPSTRLRAPRGPRTVPAAPAI